MRNKKTMTDKRVVKGAKVRCLYGSKEILTITRIRRTADEIITITFDDESKEDYEELINSSLYEFIVHKPFYGVLASMLKKRKEKENEII